MAVCELCGADVTGDNVRELLAGTLFAASTAGYVPPGEDRTGRTPDQRHEDLMIHMEMHDPVWTACSACAAVVDSRAAESASSLPAPDLIRIVGNGFQPLPAQWRVMLGGWADKCSREGGEVTVVGTPIEIELSPKASFESFVELVPRLQQQYAGRRVDDLILRHPAGDMILIAVWPATPRGR